MSAAIEPFRAAVPEAVLADLRRRLARVRYPEPAPDGEPWSYGTDLVYLKELCAYWRDAFDWRAVEARLNALPQFVTEIDGQRLYFLHLRSPESDAFPLILTHGWPGSVLEFEKVLPLLCDPARHGGRREDAFHLVVPAIPGYGWSGPTHARGWDSERVARAEIELMRRLGYARYGAQGGDWGSIIATQIARLDPGRCAAIHLNMVVPLPVHLENPLAGLDAAEKQRVAEFSRFQEEEMGYFTLQSTKPQTLAFALHDSPAGLAAWIVEKFRAWSDCGGDVERCFTKDELLANVTLYWVTGTIASSCRLYYEVFRTGNFGYNQGRVDVPTGCAVFPAEPYNGPRAWAEQGYRIAEWREMPRGGHFAAMEQPELFADAVRSFFAAVRR